MCSPLGMHVPNLLIKINTVDFVLRDLPPTSISLNNHFTKCGCSKKKQLVIANFCALYIPKLIPI